MEVLNTTMETASLFHRSQSPEGLVKYHWIDDFIDVASVLPISHCSDLEGRPLQQARDLVTNLWDVLDNILGLAIGIQDFADRTRNSLYLRQWADHGVADSTQLLLKWRQSQGLDRARDLSAQASHALGDERTSSLKSIDKWYQEHRSSLLEHQGSAYETIKALKEQQEAAESANKGRFDIEFLKLHDLRLRGLRMWCCAVAPPHDANQ